MSQTIILKHSTVKDKLPSSAQYGEVFVNYHSENPFLATLNNQGQFEKFLSENKLNELYYNKSQVNDIIANIESGGTIEFDDYYKKNEVDTLLQGKSDTAHTHDYSQILNTPDLSNFATLSDIPSINGLASEVWVGENYQPKGNYLTEHQSLENYYTKSEADNKFLTSHQDLSDYVQKSDLDEYLTIASASTIYATKEDLEEFTPTVDAYSKEETDTLLAGKASSAHTHNYETLTNKPDLSDFATKGEIPDTNGFATKQELEDYQMKSGMSAYLLASEAQETYQPKGTYVVPSDLNNYVTSGYAEETFAKKGDIPTDVYTKSETDNLLAGKASSSHTHTMSEITDLDIPKTWRGTLSEYNNLTEIDNDTLYIITDSSEQLVTSGDVESMISGYTNLTEVQTLLEGYSTTAHTHSYNDLTDKPTIPSTDNLATKAELVNYQPVSGMSAYSQTGHTHDYSEIQNTPDLSGFASLSDIPDTSNFITSAFTEEHYMKIGSTLTDVYTKVESDSKFQPQSGMTDYALKSELPSTTGLASETWVSQNFSTTAHTHSDLATKTELDDYLTIASASTIYATKEELEEFTPSDNYAGTVWTGTLSEYNNLTVIDTDTLYVITDANLQYVTSGQVESMISGYTNLTEVQTLLEGYSTTSHTHSYNDLTDKPTIPSTDNLATKAELVNYQPVSGMSDYVTDSELSTTLEGYSTTAHTHSQYLTETSADTRYARVISLTQAEYDALVQNDQVEQGVLYCIIEQSNS